MIHPRATADLSRKAVLLRGLAITEDFEFVDRSAIINTLGCRVAISIPEPADAAIDPAYSFFHIEREAVTAGGTVGVDVHLRNKYNQGVTLSESTTVLVQTLQTRATLTGQGLSRHSTPPDP